MTCESCKPYFPGHQEVATVLDGAVLPAGNPVTPAAKPPTQVAGVVGIDAAEMLPAPATNWVMLARLPPFQMWAAERLRNTSGKDALEHAMDLIRQRGAGEDVYTEYAAWHAAKGYWPNETPMGELKDA